MSTAADEMQASASLPLRLRMRADLEVERQCYLSRAYWVIKDPIGLKYYRFEDEEYSILQMLDGRTSLAQIKRRFEEKFPPQRITTSNLHHFLARLHRSGLVLSDAPGQGLALFERGQEVRRREWLQMASSLLALQFKGVDPERFLSRTYPLIRWLFHPLTVALCILLALGALGLVTVQFETFQQRLPTFEQFFGPRNWLLLAVVLGVTKILHELGHGYSCKHFGGECHEIGAMLLVLTPCLYCNVSDSWLLPNKWHRAAIGAAGMYVELLLATLATFLWWFTEPVTLVNQLALRVMFVCSISTVLFNGNPLLRYDGYYILSDILEIPNLRQKAGETLQRMMAQWCLGLKMPPSQFLPNRNRGLFALYTVASSAYRWVVLFSILMFLNKVFAPYGLQVIGQLLLMVSLFSLIVMPIWKMACFLYVPGRMDQVKRKNVLMTAGVLAGLLALVMLVPLPYRVTCPVEIRAADSVPVYVQTAGEVRHVLVKPGDEVQQGQLLVQLQNYPLEKSIAELASKQQQKAAELAALRRRRFRDPSVGSDIAEAEAELASMEQQMGELRLDRAQLEICAPVAGTVFAAPLRTAPSSTEGELATWSGTPLDPQNLHTHLEESVHVCGIGDPRRAEAILIVDQADVELIRVGQQVALKLDAFTGTTRHGTITEIAESDLKVASPGMSHQAGGSLATRADASGAQHPLSASYQARVPLDNRAGLYRYGMRGSAKIYCPWQTLGWRAWRSILRTFRFEM